MRNLLFITLIALSACTTIKQNRGAEVRDVKVEQISPSSTKQDVFALLGSPSTKSTYGTETWYYINSTTKRQIIEGNKLIRQNVLAISFDEGGYVSNMEVYDNNDARDVQMADRETPTAGKKLTAIEQILGNVGKFNTENMQTGSNPGSTRGPGTRPY